MKKSAWIDFLICLFLGGYGVHKFRERKIGLGLLYLFTGGLFTFGWFYDCVVYLYTAICYSRSDFIGEESQCDKPKAKKIGWIAVVAWIVILIIAISGCSSDDGNITPPVDDSSVIVDQNGVVEEETGADDEEISFDDLLEENSQTNEGETDEPEQGGGESAPTGTDTKVETPAETHTHSFSAATCVAAKVCSCGATEGAPLGHNWKNATCSSPKTCSVCGVTEGSANGHSYSSGSCTVCGADDPNYVREVMVWIPTNGGTKYHSKSTCSQMENPDYVTKSEAENLGFGPCGRCYK